MGDASELGIVCECFPSVDTAIVNRFKSISQDIQRSEACSAHKCDSVQNRSRHDESAKSGEFNTVKDIEEIVVGAVDGVTTYLRCDNRGQKQNGPEVMLRLLLYTLKDR